MRVLVNSLLFLACCTQITFAGAQAPPQKLLGRVVDADSKNALKDVSVSVVGDLGVAPTVTDGNGGFSLDLVPDVKPGTTVWIKFERTGYEILKMRATPSFDLAPTYLLSHIGGNQTHKPVGSQPIPHQPDLIPTQPPMFSESTDTYNISGGVSVTLTKEHSSMCLVMWHDACLMKGYIDNKTFLVDASLFVGVGHGSVEIIRNELHKNIPEWDRCFDATALEVVDENLVPVFQMRYTTPNDIVIYGIFHTEDTTVVAAPKNRLGFHPNSQAVTKAEYPVKPIFKYPSRTYHCKVLEPDPPAVNNATGPYRGLSSKEFCERVNKEADKIYALSSDYYARLDQAKSTNKSDPQEARNLVRRSFSDEFVECCWKTAREMHEELIFRLKPIKDSENESVMDEVDFERAHNPTGVIITTGWDVSRYLKALCGQLPTNTAVAPYGIANAAPNFGTQIVNNVPAIRALSDQESLDFTTALSKSTGVLVVLPASSSDDVFPLSKQICSAAEKARWGSVCPTDRSALMGQSITAQGLECYSPNWESSYSKAFKDAMTAAGLGCRYFPKAYDPGTGVSFGGGVVLLIGSPTQN